MKVFRLEDLLTDRERKCEAQLSIIVDKIMMDPRQGAGTVCPSKWKFKIVLIVFPCHTAKRMRILNLHQNHKRKSQMTGENSL